MKRVSFILSILWLFLIIPVNGHSHATTFNSESKKNLRLLSCDKTILSATRHDAKKWGPEHILFCGEKKVEDHWVSSVPNTYAIIDLGESYMISMFRQFDSKSMRDKFPNVSDYNIYVTDKDPSVEEDWQLVVSKKYQGNVSEKIDECTPVKARYVKYEALLGNDALRLYKFEVWGEDVSDVPVEEDKNSSAWIWITILAVVVLGGGGFFFFKRKEFRF